jgi:hypothetical protein
LQKEGSRQANRAPEGSEGRTATTGNVDFHGDYVINVTYAKADDDFKRDAAAKLEAFIASKAPAENTSTTSTTWVN